MELFIQTVDPQEIQLARELSVIDGVNIPTEWYQGKRLEDKVALQKTISKEFSGVNIQVTPTDHSQMYDEVHNMILGGMDSESTIFEIPMNFHGLLACKNLYDEGIMVNISGIQTAPQAYLAARAGASYLNLDIKHLESDDQNNTPVVNQILSLMSYHGLQNRVMISGMTHPAHFHHALAIGAQTASVPLSVLLILADPSLLEATEEVPEKQEKKRKSKKASK